MSYSGYLASYGLLKKYIAEECISKKYFTISFLCVGLFDIAVCFTTTQFDYKVVEYTKIRSFLNTNQK